MTDLKFCALLSVVLNQWVITGKLSFKIVLSYDVHLPYCYLTIQILSFIFTPVGPKKVSKIRRKFLINNVFARILTLFLAPALSTLANRNTNTTKILRITGKHDTHIPQSKLNFLTKYYRRTKFGDRFVIYLKLSYRFKKNLASNFVSFFDSDKNESFTIYR